MRFPMLACGVATLTTNDLHCGPTDQEAGRAVVMVAPLVLLLGFGVQWLLLALWRRRYEEIALRWGPNLVLLGIVSGFAAAMITVEPTSLRWAGEALWLFGASYATVLLLATRAFLQFDRRRAFTLPHLAPLLLQVAPAVVLGLGLIGHTDVQEVLWIFPGFGGWAAGGLYLVLLVEAAIRTRRRASPTG
ncbi:MAG: hypothetical protein EXR72_21430 [Myxococcales bacterium]|nr:hypothetical protein [Myxococcales bacterium]